MPWNSEIGRPNCLRSLTYWTREVERALRDAERLCAPTSGRERSSAPIAFAEAGTFLADSSPRHDAVVEHDLTGRRAAHTHLVFELADREPGKLDSTTNTLMPRWPALGSVLANTV